MKNSTMLELPFVGTWLVLNGGDTIAMNHHNGNKAQNYAFDFTKVGLDGKSYKDDGKNNEDFYCFGQAILCPADGEVIEAVDGVRDNRPGSGNYLAGAGNYLVVKHGDKEFSFMAHLRKGSLLVRAGDVINQGQRLGECGNSGTSFAPHFHYHLQDSEELVSYSCEYDVTDLTNGNFPTEIELCEIAAGIKVYFSGVEVKSHKKQLYSPQRGDSISSSRA